MLPLRKLGNAGLEVSALGLGCMGLTWAYGNTDEEESLQVLRRAYDLGVTFWDTAEIYGPHINELLIGRALKSLSRNKIVIATKFGFDINDKNEMVGLNSQPDHIRKALDGSLKRLGTDYIDLYYQHRLDPMVPIEDVIGVLAQCVKEGKIKHIGLSEVGPTTIRRAHAVYPIAAVQSEYSLWERGVEAHVLPVLEELNIGFVPYSPLGRGFLTGKLKNTQELEANDWRKTNFPRIQPENLRHNLALVDKLTEIATAYHVTPGQIALAWLLRKNPHYVPIPGTKRIAYLEENVGAIKVKLTDAEWLALDKFIYSFKPEGQRYLDSGMKTIDTK